MTAASLPDPAAGRRTLALVVGLLLLPFILGTALYLSGWRPSQPGNRGELLQPPPALGPGIPAEAAGKWLLVLALDGPCANECAARVDEMRRIQVSMNKEMGRIRRLVLAPDPDDPGLAALRAAQPDLLLARRNDGSTGLERYVADPQGNLILRYAPQARTKDIRTDLDRLLRFAWTG